MTDNLTPEQRSYCMSRVRGKDTGLEKTVRAELRRRGLKFRVYASGLPGKPDIAFRPSKVAVFIDGDFWHGYRFPQWRPKISSFWQVKIDKNRRRDRKNFAKLRRMGWRVLRLWQHELEKDFASCIRRITTAARLG